MIRLLFLLCLIAACSTASHYRQIDNEWMLLGRIGKQEIFTRFEPFKKNYDTYAVSDSMNVFLKQMEKSVHIEIFFGSWCGDSKRNLPPFLKIVDACADKISYRIYGLDRTKKSTDGLTEKYAIKRVPTMVFLQNGREIGRFTEHPVQSIEADVIRILKSNGPQ